MRGTAAAEHLAITPVSADLVDKDRGARLGCRDHRAHRIGHPVDHAVLGVRVITRQQGDRDDGHGVESNTQPTVGAGKVQRLCTAVDAQATEQTPEVHLDGVLADFEFVGNVAVGQALVQHQNQLLLALGKLGGA